MKLSGIPGPQTRLNPFGVGFIWDLFKFVLLLAAVAWLITRGTRQLGYNWQWYRILKYLYHFENGKLSAGPLIRGLLVTFQITSLSMLLAFSIGLATAFLRLSHSVSARMLARSYLEIVRNTPLLVQLFFIYFVLSPVLDTGRFASAILALSLFEGAYLSEIFRAGIISIPVGQWEAAGALGLDRFNTYRHVILPQAVRWVLPPLTGQAVSLVKDSALVSTIAIYDLTMQGQAIISETYMVFEVWLVVALIYLLVTGSMSICTGLLENRLKIRE